METGSTQRSRLRLALPLGLAFTAMFASAPGQSFLFAVFIDHILSGTGLSRTAFSALYAGATVVSATLSFSLGHAADRTGLRVVWAVVAAGLAAACLLESLAHGLLLAAVGLALLRSFGQGSFPLLGTLVVNHWYTVRRGAAMAAASFGITIGSVALPPLLALLIDGVGWRTTYRLIALILVIFVLPLAALVRSPTAAGPTAHVSEAPPPDRVAPTPIARRIGRGRLPLPNRSAALLLVALSTPALVTTAITFHAVSLLGSRGISAPAAAAALSLLGIASAAGTLSAGTLADRLATRTLLATLAATLTAGSAILVVPSGSVSYLGFAVIGFANGIWSVASGITWARTYGLVALGRLQGLASATTIAAAAAGPLPLALSVGATGSYTAGLLFLVAAAAIALFAALSWRAPEQRPPA
jgi:sugar phosphate permease